MKYFADYMNESIYAIDENSGDGVMVNARGRHEMHTDSIPWVEEENNTFCRADGLGGGHGLDTGFLCL